MEIPGDRTTWEKGVEQILRRTPGGAVRFIELNDGNSLLKNC
jgi:hypothetical protein